VKGLALVQLIIIYANDDFFNHDTTSMITTDDFSLSGSFGEVYRGEWHGTVSHSVFQI
jgi:hypothetical protein